MPLDPNLQTFVDTVNSAGQPPVHTLPIEDQRSGIALLSAFSQQPENVEVTERTIPGPAGEVAVRVYRVAGTVGPQPGLVYFHGGGYAIGSLDSHDAPCGDLALGAACTVVAVDYRLAPEHPFPAAIDDAAGALAYVATHASEFGIDPDRIAVGGDSAGGGLTAVIARRAHEGGGPSLAAQLLVYPWVDLTCSKASVDENAHGYLLEKDALTAWRGLYAGERDWTDPDLSPLAVEDLSGLPPAVVVTAEFDPLRDEGDAYAARLADAAVPVVHLRYPGLVHAFLHLTTVSEACRSAVDEIGAELGKLLHL